MATVLNTIYPPQVETFMPSFCYNDSAKVWFNVSSYNEDMISKIKFIHISMVDQRNNANVFAGINENDIVYPQYYPVMFNGIKIDNNSSSNKMGYDPNEQMYWVKIPSQILKTAPYYNTNQYYKIQLRFDLTGSEGYVAHSDEYSNPTNFFYWNDDSDNTADALGLALYTNYNQDNFSEWSRGTLVKPILFSELAIQNLDTSIRSNINPSTDVPIAGRIIFNKISGDNYSREENEQLSWYQIKIFDDTKTFEYLDSNKIYTDKNQINYKIDTSKLSVNTNYQIQITYSTNNGYVNTEYYPIKIVNYNAITNVDYSEVIDEENGAIILNITDLERYSNGYLTIRRSSYKTNFTEWELLASKDISSLSEWKFIDTTLESMTGYRYQLQYMNDSEIYGPIYIKDEDIIHCDFYGGLFSDNQKTLKISFNFELTNQTNAVNRAKVDTLGGQYPIFTQNSKLKYHIYTISGRISTEDNGELFLPKEEVFGDEFYNYRYNPTTTLPHNKECQSIKSNNDWLYEREYRGAVENWLNNGKPKLFRSMTEGNLIVILDNVSMTPDRVLGRRLYDFSATMYEVGNGESLDSISSFGLFDVIDER